jgi:hypothetical protein
MRSAEFISSHDLYRQFQNSEFYRDDANYLEMLQALGKFINHLNLTPEQRKIAVRKLVARASVEIREDS